MMMETVPSGTILHRHYRVERVLGSGGFGHVYLTIDLQTNQQYALKEYLVTGASGQEQLQHEAQMLGQSHHPSLPVFRDAFSERGRYYIVLSYIEGNDLTDIMRVTRMRNEVVPLSRLLGWMVSICEAVTFLHNQHPPVIHRDIKPDNIRVMPNGTAVLVDLGNAKEAADGKRTLLFIRHQGTPGYAPPEQYPGGSGTDARSDVYALGGTLFFALTTHEPPSVSTRNQSLQQGQQDLPTLQQVLATNPPEDTADPQRSFRLGATKPQKPAPRHLRHVAQLGALSPQLLDQVNRIIMRAMALRPDKRYQSVAEMSSDLRKVLTVLPAPAAQAAPPRTVDPHSTQPDLPQLYETVQAAKEQAAQSANPTTVQQPGTTMTCPRCGAIITDQSTYCRVCGTPLRQAPRNSVDASASPQSGATKQQPSSSSGHNIAEDQTVVIQPHGQLQNQPKGQANPSAAPIAMPPRQTLAQHNRDAQSAVSPPTQIARPAQAPAQLVLPSEPVKTGSWKTPQLPSQTPQLPSVQVSAPVKHPSASPIDANRSSTRSRLLILTIIVLVVLIVVLIIFLVLHGQSSHAAEIWQRIEAQAAPYERNVLLSIPGISSNTGLTVSTATAPAWLWTCGAGIPAITGITC